MLNIEKYLDIIVEIEKQDGCGVAVVNGRPVPCETSKCKMCEFGNYTPRCEITLLQWLAQEYEEPKVTIPPGTPIDTKVLVSDSGENWLKRYYAGFKNGKHHAWLGGADSWSKDRDDDVAFWEYMKLAEED